MRTSNNISTDINKNPMYMLEKTGSFNTITADLQNTWSIQRHKDKSGTDGALREFTEY